MTSFGTRGTRFAALAVGITGLVDGAQAQVGLLATDGDIVAIHGNAVPDSTGTAIPNLSFGVPSGTSSPFDSPVMDEAGNVFFRARFIDSTTGIDTWADRALFYGDSPSSLVMVARGGDPAPGQCVDVQYRTSTGSASPLGSSPRLSPDGRAWFGSSLWDSGLGVNCTLTSADDDAVFGSFVGSIGTMVQQGSVAPGTGGATWAQAFSSPSQQFTGINRNGHIYFQGTLVNGTGVPPVNTLAGTNNQAGIWAGLPTGLELVARKNDPVTGLGGAVVINTSSSIGFVTQMNDSNDLLWDCTLAQDPGTTPATDAFNDRALVIWSAGTLTNNVLLREGDLAPTADGSRYGSIAASGSWSPSVAPSTGFTRSGNVLMVCELTSTPNPGMDDRAVFRGSLAGGMSLVARRGQQAPGFPVGGVIDGFNTTNCAQNDAGQVALEGFVLNDVGLGIDSTNDSAIWAGDPSSLALVVREGEVMPGTGGSIAGSLNGQTMTFNDQCQVLFRCTLSGGSFPGSSLWAWDPVLGLMPIILNGDMIEVAPADFRVVNSIGSAGNQNNTDGASLYFGHDGRVALNIGFSDNTDAIMRVVVPTSKTMTSYCFGDGGTPLGCTSCPCGNDVPGTIGGCRNSNSTSAVLVGSGLAMVGNDSMRFEVTGATPVTFGVLVSADNRLPAAGGACPEGSGIQAFDGLRCVGGSLLRHGTRSSDASGDIGVTGAGWGPPNGPAGGLIASGGFVMGQTRNFQCFYRENVLLGCLTGQNTTNAVSVTFL